MTMPIAQTGTVAIRRFRPDDAPAVRDLFAHAQDDFVSSYLHTEADRQGFREYVDGALTHDLADIGHSYLERPGSNFWIAELDGQSAGCLGAYRRSGAEAEIRRFAVRREARRRGIAGRLLDTAEAFCRDAGYARVIVWTSNHMTAAIAFLERRGYREVEEHAFPHTSLTLYLYERELADNTAR